MPKRSNLVIVLADGEHARLVRCSACRRRDLLHGGQDQHRRFDHPRHAARPRQAFDLMHAGESIRSVVLF